jgi:hypothetical protein
MNLTWLFVAALFVIAVWLLRRSGVDLPRRIALLFYLLVLVYLWRPLTEDVTIVAADVVRLAAPWSEVYAPGRPPVSKYEVSNSNLQDVTMQIAPWAHQVQEAWRSGEVPLWNAAAGCGYPLLANGQSTPLSPLRLLTLPLSFAHAWTAECALRLLLALTLTFLFCRRRYSVAASVLAAMTYAFSTWMMVWLQFPIAGASALLPGVLLAIDLLIERLTRARFVAASLLFAATVLSGQPETVFQVGLFAAAYGLWVALLEHGTRNTEHGTTGDGALLEHGTRNTEHGTTGEGEHEKRAAGLCSVFRVQRSVFGSMFRPLATIACASLVAALIASPFLVPFAEAAARSQRLADVRETPDMTVSPLPSFDSAVLLLQPRFFGQLPTERPWGATYNESICGFAGVLAIVCAIAAPFFLIRGRRWREREMLYMLALLVCLGVVLSWPGVTKAFHLLAGLAPSGRMRIGVCWFASLLVAAVVDWSRRESRVPLLIGTLAVAATMLALLRTTAFPTRGHYDAAVYAFFPSLPMLLALTLLPLRRAFVMAGIGVLLLVDLWSAGSHWDPRLPSRALYPKTPLIAALQQLHEHDTQSFRILGIGSQLYPNTNAVYGFDDVRVHDPMALHSYETFLQTMTGWEPRSYYEKWNDTETSVIDLLNAKYVVTAPGRELAAPRYVQRYAGRDGRIYENHDVLPLFFPVRHVLAGGDLRTHTDWRYTALVSRLPRSAVRELSEPWTGRDASVRIVRNGISRYTLHIDAPRTTLIVSSIASAPGWRAGGFPVVDVNGPFFGFVFPAGKHVVEVAYRPLSFYVPAIVAVLTLAALLLYSAKKSPRSVAPAIAAPPQNDIGT